jgi:hypothetical protein
MNRCHVILEMTDVVERLNLRLAYRVVADDLVRV